MEPPTRLLFGLTGSRRRGGKPMSGPSAVQAWISVASWLVAVGAGSWVVWRELAPSLRAARRQAVASQAWAEVSALGWYGGPGLRCQWRLARLVVAGLTVALGWSLLLWLTHPGLPLAARLLGAA